MSGAHTSLPASDAESWSPESEPNASGLVGVTNREGRNEIRLEDGADLGGHTLLSRPPSPQGRKSLFRR